MATLWTPPANPSPNLRTALAYITAMEQMDERILSDTLDRTVQYEILPKRLTRPAVGKEHHMVYFRDLCRKFQKPIRRDVHDVIEMGDHIVIHMTGYGTSITGHPYTNEYMIILRLMASSTGDGTRKIGGVKEFVDSQASKDFFPAESRRMAEAEAAAREAAKAKRKKR